MTVGIVGLGLIGGSLARTIRLHTDDTVLGTDTNALTMRQAFLMEGVHVADQPVIHARSPAAVGHFLPAFNAHNGHQVPALVKQPEIRLIHIGPVGKNGKQDIRVLPGAFDNIPPDHGFPAGQQDKADSELCRLHWLVMLAIRNGGICSPASSAFRRFADAFRLASANFAI